MTSRKRTARDTAQGDLKGERGGLTQALGEGSGGNPGSGQGSRLRDEGHGQYMQGRRDMAYELMQSGGLAESQLGLEILYLMPDRFVRFYTELFHQALRVGDESVMHGRSGGLEKAKGAQGIMLGSDVGAQASGTGKKFKNPVLVIGDEVAFELKAMVDKGILGVMVDTQMVMARMRREVEERSLRGDEPQGPGDIKDSSRRDSSTGNSGTNGNSGVGSALSSMKCQGYLPNRGLQGQLVRCGIFLKATWKYCPKCGQAVSGIG